MSYNIYRKQEDKLEQVAGDFNTSTAERLQGEIDELKKVVTGTFIPTFPRMNINVTRADFFKNGNIVEIYVEATTTTLKQSGGMYMEGASLPFVPKSRGNGVWIALGTTSYSGIIINDSMISGNLFFRNPAGKEMTTGDMENKTLRLSYTYIA